MGIVFFCQSCGARFEVDTRMAGKTGRCKKCGQQMSIPRAEQIASMAAMPALATAAAGGGARPASRNAGGGRGESISTRLKEGISQVGLAPLSLDRIRVTKPSPLDDAEDSKPYMLAEPELQNRGRVTRQDNVIVGTWRRQLGRIQRPFRKLSDAAYLISVPFLMLVLLGAGIRNRPIALFGAAVVVLLNLGRIVAGGVDITLSVLRDGLNLKKMGKSIRRVAESAATIGLVFLAFAFIPWLSTGESAEGGVKDRVRSTVGTVRDDVSGKVERAVNKAKDLEIPNLGAQADRSKDQP
jgi:hypothetical protein